MKELLALLLVTLPFAMMGQSEIEITATGGGGYDGNVYNSPVDYISVMGDSLAADTLVQSDFFTSLSAELAFKWRKDGSYLRWETKGEMRRYANENSADAEEIASILKYHHQGESGWRKGGYVRLRSQNRLGTNVLGSELLTPFSFRQVAVRGFMEKRTEKKNRTGLQAEFSNKNYDVCIGCDLQKNDVSLTQQEWEFKAYQLWIVGQNGGEDQKLTLEASWRSRQYKEWINYELLNPERMEDDLSPFLAIDPDVEYNPRRWRYAIVKADYSFPLSKTARIIPFIQFTRRYDASNGDFGFVQWQPGARFYLRQEKFNLYAGVSYSSRDYTDRLAQQSDGVPFPTLEYRYLRAKLRAEVLLGGGFDFYVGGSVNNRESNTNDITTRVRRSYESYEVVAGIKWQIERERDRPMDP